MSLSFHDETARNMQEKFEFILNESPHEVFDDINSDLQNEEISIVDEKGMVVENNYPKFHETQNNLLNQNIEEIFEYKIHTNIYPTTLKTLQKYAKMLRPTLTNEMIENLLNTFLFEDPLKLDFTNLLIKNTNDFWRSMCFSDKWKEFALLCLHFVTLPTSEADVERLFSSQRDMMGNKITNIGSPTLETRLRMNKRGIK